MPLYDYECEKCGMIDEFFAPIERRTKTCECGATMTRILSPRYYINPDIEIVTDNISGEMTRITSRKQLKQMCKEHGVMEKYGKGWV